MPHQAARACVPKDVIDLHDREARVDRNADDAESAARVNELEVLGAIGKQECQPVTGVEPASGERRRHTHDAAVELAKSEPAVSDVKCGPLGIVPGGAVHRVAIDPLYFGISGSSTRRSEK